MKVLKKITAFICCLTVAVSGVAVQNNEVKADTITKISTPQELVDYVISQPNGVNAELVNDIVFSEPISCEGYINSKVRNADINGNGHTISNFAVNDNGEITNSVFQYIYTSKVHDITYDGTVTITNTNKTLMGALGRKSNGTTFTKVVIKGELNLAADVDETEDIQYIGALVGEAYNTTFLECSNHMNINLLDNEKTLTIGGLVGEVDNASFEKCSNNGNIKGSEYVGGIAGWTARVNYIDCVNNGNVTTRFGEVGGIACAIDSGKAENCVNNAIIKCEIDKNEDIGWDMGGLFGRVMNYYYDGLIVNCTNKGKIECSNIVRVGGVIGSCGEYDGSEIIITGCINYGDIYHPWSSRIGGIIGGGSFTKVEDCINYGNILQDGIERPIDPSTYDQIEMYDKGGIIGMVTNNEGATEYIVSCTNEGGVRGFKHVGGIVGNVSPGANLIVDSCVNNGYLQGVMYTGGIVGYVDIEGNPSLMPKLSVVNSFNTSVLDRYNSTIDGLVGSIEEAKEFITVDSKSQKMHTHTWRDTVVKPATTTSKGKTKRNCIVCGYSCEIETPKANTDTNINKIGTNTDTNIKAKKPKKVKKLSVKNNKKRTVTIKFGKAKYAKKYEIKYATNKKFKKAKTKKTKKTKYSLKKLKKKKTYWIKVRGVNGKVKGSWSKIKKIKIKKY